MIATQRLAKTTNLYPKCFALEDIGITVGDQPVAAGGFADIHKGRIQNKSVCLKVIRLYQVSQVDYVLKVCLVQILVLVAWLTIFPYSASIRKLFSGASCHIQIFCPSTDSTAFAIDCAWFHLGWKTGILTTIWNGTLVQIVYYW